MKTELHHTEAPPQSNKFLTGNYGQYQTGIIIPDDPIAPFATAISKRSFLVFSQNKYVAVPVENIAFFYSKNACTNLVSINQKQYPIHYSLDQIQQLLTVKQFFRVNRQYLINFRMIREVEHYFARKLLVRMTIETAVPLLVPKEKVRLFLQWMENG
ncbi:LytR/AlgR family response regulator transcription factor [Flavitalea sp.]|nr:LytTR family DNA-binding domain-containing protein [Flavitalea sp.]